MRVRTLRLLQEMLESLHSIRLQAIDRGGETQSRTMLPLANGL